MSQFTLTPPPIALERDMEQQSGAPSRVSSQNFPRSAVQPTVGEPSPGPWLYKPGKDNDEIHDAQGKVILHDHIIEQQTVRAHNAENDFAFIASGVRTGNESPMPWRVVLGREPRIRMDLLDATDRVVAHFHPPAGGEMTPNWEANAFHVISLSRKEG